MPNDFPEQQILTFNSFMASYDALKMRYHKRNLGFLKEDNSYLFKLDDVPIDYKILLECASFLISSQDLICSTIGLNIPIMLLQEPNVDSNIKNAAAIVLTNSSNKISVNLAKNKDILRKDFLNEVPMSALLKSISNTTRYKRYLGNTSFDLNSFQRDFWDALSNTKDNIAISAPTSSGKSFIICNWLVSQMQSTKGSLFLYIVPTRALIYQVERDLREIIHNQGLSGIDINTVPNISLIDKDKNNILVFTQERLLALLSQGSISFDVIVIDEAHKFEEGYRGILLQQAIESLSDLSKTRMVLLSPNINNPENLFDGFGLSGVKNVINTEIPIVGQNIFWVSKAPRRGFSISLISEKEEKKELGSLKISSGPSKTELLSNISFEIGKNKSGNMIYVDGAAAAEDVAEKIAFKSEIDLSDNVEIRKIRKFIKDFIHKDYPLVETLNKGVAYHYGNMPLVIRTSIEKLFNNGYIKFLICTSTLIEGVNTPCKNIFIAGPKKGVKNYLPPRDLWNLAGRAGRWGKDFDGNIFLIEPEKEDIWGDNHSPQKNKRFPMKKRTDSFFSNIEMVISSLNEEENIDFKGVDPEEMEYFVSYLISMKIRYGDQYLDLWKQNISPEKMVRLNNSISSILNATKIPHDIILKNPGISLKSMEKLLKYFEGKKKDLKYNLAKLIPQSPVYSSDSYSSYVGLLIRIYDTFGPVILGTRSEKLASYYAIIISRWIRAYPISRIISDTINYYKNKKPRDLIRKVMSDIEEIARFKAPKYIACYSDILNYFFKAIDREDLQSQIVDLSTSLEFGVYTNTQISFVSLGLSRYASIRVAEKIEGVDLDRNQALLWLKQKQYKALQLPELIEEELDIFISGQI